MRGRSRTTANSQAASSANRLPRRAMSPTSVTMRARFSALYLTFPAGCEGRSKTGLRSHGLLPGRRVTPHLPMPVRVIRLQGVSHTRCVSPSPQPASPEQRLIIISGEEGAGKSAIVRALLPSTPHGARIDAEDIGQTNPCPMDDTFFDLLRRNVAGLVENFWAAGYVNVIAGSFLRRYSDYVSFRQLLRPSAVFLDRSPGRQGRPRSSADHPGEADHAGMARHGRPDSGRSDNPAGHRC